MKKFAFIILFAAVLQTHAQSIPNAGFENWINIGGWFENPVDWQTSNNQIVAAQVIKDLVPHAGTYAIQLTSIVGYPPNAFTGMYLNSRPFELNGFYKSFIVSGDSAAIAVDVWLNGNVVDYGQFIVNNSVPNWTPFSMSISQNIATADSANIYLLGGWLNGTNISVDDISFNYGNAIDENGESEITIFPNPVSDYLTVNNSNHHDITFSLFDVTGKLVLKNQLQEMNSLIDVRSFSDGFYVAEIQSGNELVRRKIQIVR